MNFKHLIISVFSGLAIILILFFISEYSGPGPTSPPPPGWDSNKLRGEVDSWNNRRWSKGGYDSLSSVIQNTKVVASEKERENLQLTLDGYYCNSMKLSFEDWKSQGCNLNSDNPKVAQLLVEMNEVVKGGNFKEIDTDPLNPLIKQYNDIRSANAIGGQVLSHLSKEFNDDENSGLAEKIKTLSTENHIQRCSQLMNELNIASSRLSDFDGFQVNFQIKRKSKKNNNLSDKDLCDQLRRDFPEVDKYKFYYK